MASTHTLTGNVYDLTGATLGATGVRVTVVTNLPAKSALIDKTTNSIHLGGKHADLNPSTGEFSIDLIDTSATDLNVAANTLEYEVRAEYVNPATRVRSTWTSGWFPFTADANLADITTDVEPLAVQSASGYALEAKGYRDEAEAISGLTGEDAAVAFLVEDSGSATAGALSATYATAKGANIPRTLGKLRAGQNITIGVIGDSKSDPATPGNAAGGPVEKLAALLETRFGVTVTVVNGAKSGATAATQYLQGYVKTVVDAAPDLIVVHLGTNDTNSDANGLYAAGYVMDASLAAIERAAAYARDTREDGEFLFVGTGPYQDLASASNPKLLDYAAGLRALAGSVGAEWVDAYAAFLDYADDNGDSIAALMYDSTHQNAAGNDLYAATMLDHFPVTSSGPTPALAPRPTVGRYGIDTVNKATTYLGYVQTAAAGTVSGLTYALAGTGWTVETTYDVTSTAGDSITLSGDVREFLYNIDISSVAVVDFVLDGVTIAADVNLNTQSGKNSTSYWLAPFVDLAAGAHTGALVLKSGTLRVQSGAALMQAAAGGGDAGIGTTKTVKIFSTPTTVTLTTAYQDLVPDTSIPLPTGWSGMDVFFNGYITFRTSGATTATRRIDFALRENGTSVNGTRQFNVGAQAATFIFPTQALTGTVQALNRSAIVDVIAKIDDATTGTLQATFYYLDALLVRTA